MTRRTAILTVDGMSTAPATAPTAATTTLLRERPAAATTTATPPEPGPPTLPPDLLRYEQHVTLAEPHERPGLVLRTMFGSIDLLYGRRGSLEKFLVLEHLAQVPYRSWERVAQRRVARTRGRSVLARRIQRRVAEARAQHDNEQWHMLVMEDLVARRGRRLRRWRHRIVPRLLALPWQAACWMLHLTRPAWGYRLNAAFEAHAERTYMAFVAEHPETEHQPFTGPLADRWPDRTPTVADVLRQIGHDERWHRLDSERAAREEESRRAR
jgi:hypothetical protein